MLPRPRNEKRDSAYAPGTVISSVATVVAVATFMLFQSQTSSGIWVSTYRKLSRVASVGNSCRSVGVELVAGRSAAWNTKIDREDQRGIYRCQPPGIAY